ncbi:hypothetical protein Cgig2_017086 [Carnegiea gigantea]|uniref:Uncharacterized protein n=1 Tax=Carnegiea gigantea TaxID=171969 RepID=A0A9Q1K3K1_9CARY|nr:hypothetical protein Cgig2_017086 [Carnegiea gigantea]
MTPPPSCRSTDGESSGTIHAANALLNWGRVGVRATVLVMGVDVPSIFAQISVMGRRWRKKPVGRRLRRRRVWYTNHPSMVDLMGLVLEVDELCGVLDLGKNNTKLYLANAESIDGSHAASASIRRRHVGVLTFVVMVLYVPAWIGIGGLEGRRRKKAVSRLLRWRRMLHVGHPPVRI